MSTASASRLPLMASAEENEKMELEEPWTWRPEGCSDAITSSREGIGHGSSSGFRSNRCRTKPGLPSTSIWKQKGNR